MKVGFCLLKNQLRKPSSDSLSNWSSAGKPKLMLILLDSSAFTVYVVPKAVKRPKAAYFNFANGRGGKNLSIN